MFANENKKLLQNVKKILNQNVIVRNYFVVLCR